MRHIHYSVIDHLLIQVDKGIRSLFSLPIAQRENPASSLQDSILTPEERKQSAALMRINHSGEICAQGLYYGQALAAKAPMTRQSLLNAATEETDHLAWCQERITELNSHTSYLNLLWYTGSFTLGFLTGMIHDKWSLGFVVETERQVERHLEKHLRRLPEHDNKSRAILMQMCEDEARHATTAIGAGAMDLPEFVKKLMQALSKVMTATTYYI